MQVTNALDNTFDDIRICDARSSKCDVSAKAKESETREILSCSGDSPGGTMVVAEVSENEPRVSNTRGRTRQLFAAFAANISAMALGAILSWTATALPDLRTHPQFQSLTKVEESWISSLMTLGAAAACPIAGSSIELVGRRKTILLLSVPFLLAWASIIFADNVWMLYVGRFVTGFAGGSCSIAAPVYITEIADVNLRGSLAAGFDLMITVGILYIFVIGTYVSWKIQAAACAVIPLVCAALMLCVPESPVFLVDKMRTEEAVRSLKWLRGLDSTEAIQDELSELQKYLQTCKAQQGTWQDLFKRAALLPVSIGFALMLFQQLSGIDAVMFYTVDIFKSAGTDMDENVCTIIVGAAQVVATVTAAVLVDKYGRKILLLLSAIFMVISLGALGAFFYIKDHGNSSVVAQLSWLPLTSLMIYVVAFSVGFGPIPWLYVAEIMPTNIKGLATGIVITSRWLLGFGVTMAFADLMALLGEHGGYWCLGTCCAVAAVYVLRFVPETKGKSLEDIQKLFLSSPYPSTSS